MDNPESLLLLSMARLAQGQDDRAAADAAHAAAEAGDIGAMWAALEPLGDFTRRQIAARAGELIHFDVWRARLAIENKRQAAHHYPLPPHPPRPI